MCESVFGEQKLAGMPIPPSQYFFLLSFSLFILRRENKNISGIQLALDAPLFFSLFFDCMK